MTAVSQHTAPTDAPVIDEVAERWSTRIFDPETTIDEEALRSILEAARWASSEFNTQPWRFVVTRRGSASHAAVLDSLIGFNQSWAAPAAVLLVILAETKKDDGTPLELAVYDAGQAAAFLAVQAHAVGLHTHQMSGFDADAVSAAFGLSATVRPLAVMALGTLGDPSQVSEKLAEKERQPRTRRPVAESVLIDD